MLRFLLGLMVIVLMGPPVPVQAQSATLCSGTNTTVNSSTQTVIINTCNITVGPKGSLLATALAENVCAVDEFVQMFVGTGNSPVSGSTISIPNGVTYITKLFHHSDCAGGKTAVSTISGAFQGSANSSYWVGVAISSPGGSVTWNNNIINVFAW